MLPVWMRGRVASVQAGVLVCLAQRWQLQQRLERQFQQWQRQQQQPQQ